MTTRKRMFPLDFVKEILEEDYWHDCQLIGVAPGTDRLGKEFWGIFEHEGKLYRVKYTWGTDFYMSEVGTWDDPFPQVPHGTDEIECEEVTKTSVVSWVYEPIEEAA